MADLPKAVFFDVDGVLVDSLPQHLKICRDKASEFGLKLSIPTVEEFRELVRRGVKVSPMRNFFLAVGFPEQFVDRAVADYGREFSQRYRPEAFAGADRMLRALRTEGVQLGLITSNVRNNVMPALAESMPLFDERCLFFFDRYPVPKTKAWCIGEGVRVLRIGKSDCVYVGDQPEDARAAVEAGVEFLAVTYGWGISERDGQFRSAKSVSKIPETIAELYAQSKFGSLRLAR
jgi:phosphoglycolate phosphatase-like HAD superfamily hydrolase